MQILYASGKRRLIILLLYILISKEVKKEKKNFRGLPGSFHVA